ncbi:hypothetical protein G3O08_18545 [Cryomorpha ignava]|uniref:Carboxypeptidase-like regulatory domain-containing protein n=1 Tax=Cryomorpha ignava TaxID=101383 RepID=A0A7K3WXX4_9FLAO|nr:hypothetical protein [Cryomorpha ignava]NEN25495.1 hypothetical protein [Cryomorpha ignava]
MRWILTLLLLFSLAIGYSQNETISGQVNAGSYLGPVSKVHVRMGKYSTKTDYEGKFTLRITQDESLILSHSSYNTQKIPYKAAITIKNATYYLTPSSGSANMIMEGAEVQPIYTPEFEHVFDYTFLGDTLIVLSYMNLGKPENKLDDKPYINCTFTAMYLGEMIERKVMPNNIQKLFHHPGGTVFLEGLDTCYVLNRKPNDLNVSGFSYTDYQDFVSLAYAETEQSIFYAYSYPYIPQVAHKMYNFSDDEIYLLRLVQNREYFDKVNDDYAMLTEGEIKSAMAFEKQTGINHRMFSTYLRSFRILRDIAAPYAPGFLVGDEVIIFDHRNSSVSYYDSNGKYKHFQGMFHNTLVKEELVKMIQDPYTKQLYTLHNKAGVMYLRKVDTQTGATGRPLKLHYPFAENVKVFENYVYYLHKAPADVKYNHLVRQKLPFSNELNSQDADSYYNE